MNLRNERINPDLVRYDGVRYTAETVETAVLGLPGVLDAAVVQARTNDGTGRVVAYVELADGRRVPSDAAGKLPVHDIVPLAALPITADGTIDLAMLRDIAPLNPAGIEAARERWRAQAGLSDWAFAYRERFDAGTPVARPIQEVQPAAAETAAYGVTGASPTDAEPALLIGEPLHESTEVTTLPETLRRAAELHGDRSCRFVTDDIDGQVLTYRELLNLSERAAAGLRRRGVISGDRVLLLARSQLDFVVAFWAVQLAGAIAVPVTTADYVARPAEAEALRRIWTTAMRPPVLASSDLADQVHVLLADAVVHDLDATGHGEEPLPTVSVDQDAPAIILFTSGSTGTPKGVVQTHRTIASKQRAAVQHSAYAEGDVFLNWLAIEHVVGLIHSHLLPVHLGADQVHATTQPVLADPRRWLDLVSRHRVSVTWAPNSMFALLADAVAASGSIAWDLSCLRRWINAGEQVHFSTCQRVLGLLETAGLAPDVIKPEWGMSETCNMVVVSDRLMPCKHTGVHAVSGVSADGTVVFTYPQDPEATLYVECGRVYPGTEARVVDEAGIVVPKGRIGRFQVRGATRLVEYFNNPEVNAASFTEEGWFETGDLAFVIDDTVVFVGRGADRIIINGVNLQNVDIEACVEAVEGVEPSFTAACAVRERDDITDQLAVFYVTAFADDAELRRQNDQIQTALTRHFGSPARYLLALDRERIPKTSIGKIQRSKLVRALLAGEFAEEVEGARRRAGGDSNTLPAWFFAEEWVQAQIQVTYAGPQRTTVVGISADDAFVRAIAEGFAALTLPPAGPTDAAGTDASDTSTLAEDETVVDLTLTRPGWNVDDVASVVARLAEPVPGRHTLVVSALGRATDARALAYAGQLEGLVRSLDPEGAATAAWCDVDEPGPDVASLLAREALAVHRRTRTRLREGRREVASLTPVVPTAEAVPMCAEGLVLVTGGLGGVGSIIARHLVQRYAARLVLVGRTPEAELAAEPAAALAELRALTECHYLTVDLGAHGAESALTRELAMLGPLQIDAAYHLAGLGSFGRPLSDKNGDNETRRLWDPQRLARYTAVKVDGLLAMARAVGTEVPLVAFSSVNAYFGGGGHAEYAAANSALNTAAEALRMAGHRVTSIGWSAWYGLGMSRDGTSEALLQSRGFVALDPAHALDSLDLLVQSGQTGQRTVYVGLVGEHPNVAREILRKVGWALLPVCAYVAEHEILDPHTLHPELEAVRTESIPFTADGALDLTRLTTAEVGGGEPETDHECRLAHIWGEVLGVQGLGRYDDYFLVGGHSLNAARLAIAVHAEFSIELPLHAIYQHSRLDAMAAHLEQATMDEPRETEDAMGIAHGEAADGLSHAQRRIYFAEAVEDRALYNIVAAWRLTGDIDATLLEKTLVYLTRRHESLRTSFRLADGAPQRVVAQEAGTFVEHQDLTSLDANTCGSAVEDLLVRETRHKYDLSVASLARYVIVRTTPNETVLVVCHHHLVSDGWSLGVFMRELATLYSALRAQEIPDLPAAAENIGTLIAELDARATQSPSTEAHWRSVLAEEIEPLDLPLDHPRPSLQDYAGDTLAITLDAETVRVVDQAAQTCGVTRAVFLAGVFAVYLSKLSGRLQLLFGLPAMRRGAPELTEAVGMLVNTLPVAVDLREDPAVRDLLAGLRTQIGTALEHQDFPFDRMVTLFAPERAADRPPLVQAVFNYVPQGAPPALHGASTKPVYVRHRVSKFDLSVHAYEDGDAVTLAFEYAASLFDRGTVERWQGWFRHLLTEVVADPGVRVSAVQLVGLTESDALLARCTNLRAATLPGPLGTVFAEAAIRYADCPALTHGARTLSYAELDRHSATLAAQLEDAGVRPGQRVGVAAEKTLETIIAILAVARLGSSYVPVEPDAPPAVRASLLESGAVAWTISPDGLAVAGETVATIALNFFGAGRRPTFEPDDDHEAYVVFTSGTTGRPKGVAIRSSSVVGLVTDPDWIRLDETCRLVQTGSLAFDASTFEIWGPLLAGGELILVDKETLLDPVRFAAALSRHRPTVMWLSSPLFHQLADADPGMFALCGTVVVGGDLVSAEHVARVHEIVPEVRFVNGYGPTENTTFSTTHTIKPHVPGPVPIGRAVRGSIAVPLDPWGQIVPVGVEGELHVAGEGLTIGYIGNGAPSGRFIEAPALPGVRLYRTGDFVRLDEDGVLHFRGRRDDQVKIRGHRIELAAVRHALLALPGVQDAIVTVVREGGRATLVAHVAGENLDELGLAYALRENLPSEAVPGIFHLYEALPLRASGKVDVERLVTSLAPQAPNRLIDPKDLSEPRCALLEVFRQVLGAPLLGPADSFFDHGGDSLLTIKLVSRLKARGLVVDAKQIFLAPHVDALAALLANGPTRTTGSPEDKLVDLRPGAGNGPRVLFLPPAGGTVLGYIQLARHLRTFGSAYGVEAPGLGAGEQRALLSFEEMIDFCGEAIAGQTGPDTLLAGHSLGGHIAFHLCVRLTDSGRPPRGLVVLDTPPDLGAIPVADADLSEEETKVFILAMGIGGLIEAEAERLRDLPYEQAKERLLRSARVDKRVAAFLNEEYLDRFLTLQMHQLMYSRDVTLPRRRLDLPITVLRTAGHAPEVSLLFGAWQEYSTRPVRFVDVPGDHASMMRLPHVVEVARLMDHEWGRDGHLEENA